MSQLLVNSCTTLQTLNPERKPLIPSLSTHSPQTPCPPLHLGSVSCELTLTRFPRHTAAQHGERRLPSAPSVASGKGRVERDLSRALICGRSGQFCPCRLRPDLICWTALDGCLGGSCRCINAVSWRNLEGHGCENVTSFRPVWSQESRARSRREWMVYYRSDFNDYNGAAFDHSNHFTTCRLLLVTVSVSSFRDDRNECS